MTDYTVIIADITASRKMQVYERHEWQLYLKNAIVQINDNFRDIIDAPFMITKGDEFQGVLKNLADVHQVMMKFEQLIFPLRLRYGVGYGKIHKMGSNIPIEMDGPAFHKANAALQMAKKKKSSVFVETGFETYDIAVNTIYQLIYAIKRRWSDVNYTRYWKYKELGTYERVAAEEGVSAQAVWDSLHNSNAIDVLQAENSLHFILRYYDPEKFPVTCDE
ncbi:MAG: hypothetical protein JXR46_09365 [Calditrichaceae bacterium]|nr:hypothetical protein [Calditrichaceae bacterium]MBN2709240.1 hypothetical protein [Calditrichaceae bacterium]RQV96193.1 MAG: hypothetical protein EH224_05675 [Calditrichota bacterium]